MANTAKQQLLKENTMKRLLLGLLLIASVSYGADQKTLDFCHEYIGEAIKTKPEEDRGFRAMPHQIMPITENQFRDLVQPIYRGQVQFMNISTVPRRY